MNHEVDGGSAGLALLEQRPTGVWLTGWVPPDPDAPEEPVELALELPGAHMKLLEAARSTRGDPGLPEGALRFACPLPAEAEGAGDSQIRVWHLGTGRELPGSPLRLAAAAPATAPPGPVPGAPWAAWPAGLAGTAGALGLTELADGLWTTAERPALAVRWELTFADAGTAAQPPQRGIRVIADAVSPRVVLHVRLPRAWPAPGAPMRVAFQAWLPEATEAAVQAQCEIWLTRREGAAFAPLRRLRRQRIFRRPSDVSADLLLAAEDLAGGELWLTLQALEAKGLCALPPRLLSPAQPLGPVFEDGRLGSAFAHCAELVRLHGEAAAAQPPLLPAPPSPATALLPAAPLAAGHPFTQIVLPVYNGDEVVRGCLRALKAAATGPMQVLVVDDGSRAFTAEMLRQEVDGDSRFVLHRREVNRGYTKSINEGVLLTDAEWIVILNSDTLPPRGWLDRLHAAARARPGTGMAGPLSNAATWQSIPAAKRPDGSWSTNDMIEPRHIDRVQALLDATSERAYPEFPVLNGFCTLIARAVFDRIGLFDEEAFPMGYGEETDLCLRARRAGFRLTVADDAFVFHHKSVSFGSVGRARLTRAGGLEMTNKHLGANIAALENRMQACLPLARLRARLVDALAALD